MSNNNSLYVGVEIEGRKLKAALVSANGQVLQEHTDSTKHKSAEEFTGQIVEMLNHFKQAATNYGHLVAAGIGVPGLINLKTNKIEVLPNLPQVSTSLLYEEIMRSTGMPVIFDNDGNVGVYGEWQAGAAQGYSNIIYVTIGTGVGAGIILRGEMFRGTAGFAGEFGHMTINVDGLDCACGNIGCLETVASGPNIVRRMQQRLYRDRTSSLSGMAIPRDREMVADDIIKAALAGDGLSHVVLERTGRYLGIATGGLINLLNPDMVVFGGPIMQVGDILLKPIIEETRQRAFGPSFDSCQIVAGKLGTLAGVVGAALLARDTIKP